MQTDIIQHIGQIGVPIKNLQRAMLFYQEKLGLPLLFNTDNMAFFDCGRLRIMLTHPEKEAFDHPSSVIYFQVDDIQSSYRQLKEKQVTFIDEPHMVTKMGNTETWMVFFSDTENNTHALMSEVIS
ncbi:VOC family protein [Oceanobacillus neutriphilus]|uniref:VOC domain-containing protein n=1 Tax=Oceanobacillus neutriphilus TaxID=531815 RepID=A0ABQ2NZP6_9BACI|nr:VOC family protein [Oceanobacillus neutriphilus]GGP14616.1 hypothetical protein GCM10011346_39280 [Oceanobacillus neutriphilus]